MGMSQSYLLKDEGTILIDTGDQNRSKKFFKYLHEHSINPTEIKLIIITHAHMDHIGSAKAIKDFTGAKIAIHREDKDPLEKGEIQLPPGVTTWGKILIGFMSIFAPLFSIEKVKADIVLGNDDFDLKEYGINGKIIHTPGHTLGSVSVLLETGEAIVGDSAFNALPMTLRPALPPFAHDISLAKKSLKSLIDQGAKTIYPSHGKPFPLDELKDNVS